MTTVRMDAATEARRSAATSAFKQHAHELYHRLNDKPGRPAPCHQCANIARSEKGFQL